MHNGNDIGHIDLQHGSCLSLLSFCLKQADKGHALVFDKEQPWSLSPVFFHYDKGGEMSQTNIMNCRLSRLICQSGAG